MGEPDNEQLPEEDEIPPLKGSVLAEEKRSLGRLDVRIGEGISVFLRFGDDAPTHEFTVIDYSAIGLGIEVRDPEFDPASVRAGREVAAIFRTSKRNLPGLDTPQGLPLRCRVIAQPRPGPTGRPRFGLEILPFRTQQRIEDEIARKTLQLPARPRLVGLLVDPFQYDQTSLITVLRMSRSFMVVRNSESVFAIFPLQKIEFSLNLFSGNDPIRGQVMWVRRHGRQTHFAVQIDDMSVETDRSIVRYFMRFIKWPPFIFKRYGFDTSNIKNIIQFRFVKTQNDYIAVLRLRRMAYIAARKLKRETNLSRLYSEYDEQSRILTAWHHDQLVGSVAMRFGNGEDLKFEFQRHFKAAELMRKLPRGSEIIEVSRLCMHHDYRKSDILIGLFERVFQVLITSGRSYVLASCDKHLWPIYESIGFHKTGLRYHVIREASGLRVDLDIIIANKRVGTYGGDRHFDLLRWEQVYRGITDHLDSAGVINKTPRHLLASPANRIYIDAMHLSRELQQEFHELQRIISRSQYRVEEELDSLSQDIRNPEFFWGTLNYLLDQTIRLVRSFPSTARPTPGDPRGTEDPKQD